MARRLPFYYGWLLVGVAFVEGALSVGISIWSFGVFVAPMEAEFGWSRSTFFLALTLRSLLGGLISPFVGPLQDSRWARWLYLASFVLMAASLIGVRWVQTPWQFYLVYGGLGALAFLGAGQMLSTVILPKWFIRQRGRALSLASLGTGFGPFIFPTISQRLVDVVGWRDAWVVLGIVVLALMLPLSLLVRTRPEDIGLLPDGDPAASVTGPRPARIRRAERDYTAREAARTGAFWLLLVSAGIAGLGISGFQANLIPYFTSNGLTAKQAALFLSIYSLCSMGSRLLWGTLADRHPIRLVMAAQSALTAVSIVGLLLFLDPPLVFAVAVIHGLSLGGYFLLRPLAVADYFGRAHLGAINGLMRPFNTLSGALSPLIVAGLYDLRGSYVLAYVVVTLAWVVSAVSVLAARPPRPAIAQPMPSPEPTPSHS